MKKLCKIKEGRILFGVCGGIAEFLGVDPTVVRLLWAALSLTGTGVLLYTAAAFIMPEHSEVE